MASAEFDTLAETRELQSAGIEAAHAEAIVSTLRRTTDGLLTESRFESAMAEQRSYLDKHLAELKSEIYRYLWLHGSMIVLILTSLYAMVESWSRGQL